MEDGVKWGLVERGYPVVAVLLSHLGTGPCAVGLAACTVPYVEVGGCGRLHVDGGLAAWLRCRTGSRCRSYRTGLVRSGNVKAGSTEELVVVALSHQLHARRSTVVGSSTQLNTHFTVCSLGADDIAIVAILLLHDGALVVDTSCTTGKNHCLDAGLIYIVVLNPYTGSARHGKDNGVGSRPVLGNGTAIAARVVVVDERNGIAAVIGIAGYTFVRESAVVAIAYSLIDDILQREVESSRSLASSIDPVHHSIVVAIPIFTN